MISAPRETLEVTFGGKIAFDPVEQGRRIIEAHNDWCLRIARVSPQLRPVPIVLTEH